MLVSVIHENVDLVLGIKNIFKLEVIINLRQSYFSFLNRYIPFFPKEQVILKLPEQMFIEMKTPFIDEIAGLVIVKMLDKKAEYINVKSKVCEKYSFFGCFVDLWGMLLLIGPYLWLVLGFGHVSLRAY